MDRDPFELVGDTLDGQFRVLGRVDSGQPVGHNRKRPAARRERVFRAQSQAQANTVQAIVAGFNAALTEVLGQLVSWTNAKGM